MSKKITTCTIASPGINIGKAYVYRDHRVIIPRYTIKEENVNAEIKRLEEAVEQTKKEITGIQAQIATNLTTEMSDIFTSHLMVLEDPLIIDKAIKTIRTDRRNVEWVINNITLELINSLNSIEDEYIRERIIDISDINKRLIANLQKTETHSLAELDEEVIIFAHDLTPSETAVMNRDFVLGFVTDKGGRTSHTAIMARALEIPAIVGTHNATSIVKNGDMVILDAIHGEIIINPTPEEIEEFHSFRRYFLAMEEELSKLTSLPARTIDNEEIFIYGNIEIPDEKEIIKSHGAQGIGLYRSEFLFLDRSLPDEEQQYREYKKVVEFFNPLPVTIRTLDVGGDKIYSHTQNFQERNPFLGCRAIRFSLENEDLFRVQLRAILRASHHGTVKLMFPMITTLEELKRARSLTETIMDELRAKEIPFDENIQIGVMIEVPSAAINADLLAKYSDFFSIGTNDLVQYILAVDRISEKIAYLYNPLNIAVLRFLKRLVEVSGENGVPISICGEIAGEPRYIMTLIGLGFRHFSMSPTYMNQVKNLIRSITVSECNALVVEILQMDDTRLIEERVFREFELKNPRSII